MSYKSIPACDNCFFVAWLATIVLSFAYPSHVILNKCFNKNKNRSSPVNIRKRPSSVFSNSTNGLVEEQSKIKYFSCLSLEIFGLTALWNLVLYSFIRALGTIHISGVIMIFSTNFAFDYMASWIVLEEQFIPTKVRFISFCSSAR
jgi:hypothetical protein